MNENKCVLIIDDNLPLGIIANTAAILGISLGRSLPEMVGVDVIDSAGSVHLGIVEFPVPVLRGSAESLKTLREKLYASEYADLTVVDFSDLAQGCKNYPDYIVKMRSVCGNELQYLGLAVCGATRKVNKLTGNLPLLR